MSKFRRNRPDLHWPPRSDEEMLAWQRAVGTDLEDVVDDGVHPPVHLNERVDEIEEMTIRQIQVLENLTDEKIAKLNLTSSATGYTVRDIWGKKALPSVGQHGNLTLSVPAFDSAFVLLKPAGSV